MVEVVLSNGDRAEAEDAECAFLAALTLLEDSWRANPVQGYAPTVSFIVDGKTVRSGLTRKDLLSA